VTTIQVYAIQNNYLISCNKIKLQALSGKYANVRLTTVELNKTVTGLVTNQSINLAVTYRTVYHGFEKEIYQNTIV
jgi:hypothetical protein